MAFFFRLRYRIPDSVKNKGEAEIIVAEIRLKGKLGEYYDGQTIEILDEPKSILGAVWVHITGK